MQALAYHPMSVEKGNDRFQEKVERRTPASGPTSFAKTTAACFRILLISSRLV